MIIIFSILYNTLILFCFEAIQNKIKLYDYPNLSRKIHKEKVPLLGGFIFITNFFIYIFFLFLINNFIFNNFLGFENILSFYVFLVSILLFFIIGFFDDKIFLSANLRFVIFIIIIFINLTISKDLHISEIRLSFIKEFSIGNYSFFWTTICFLLFINAFNFFDGINLQSSGFIFALSSFFLTKNILFDFFIIILISNLCFFFLNKKSKCFLGNSGSYFIPFLIGSLFIIAYNNNKSIYADEIVVLMLIPGLDLLRLFVQRLINHKNPFLPDNNHLHHYLLKKYSSNMTFFIIQLLIWIPYIFTQLVGYFFLAILSQLIIYFFLVIKYKN